MSRFEMCEYFTRQQHFMEAIIIRLFAAGFSPENYKFTNVHRFTIFTLQCKKSPSLHFSLF